MLPSKPRTFPPYKQTTCLEPGGACQPLAPLLAVTFEALLLARSSSTGRLILSRHQVQVQEGMMFTFADLLKRQMSSVLNLYGLNTYSCWSCTNNRWWDLCVISHGLVLQMMIWHWQLILNHMALPECTL